MHLSTFPPRHTSIDPSQASIFLVFGVMDITAGRCYVFRAVKKGGEGTSSSQAHTWSPQRQHPKLTGEHVRRDPEHACVPAPLGSAGPGAPAQAMGNAVQQAPEGRDVLVPGEAQLREVHAAQCGGAGRGGAGEAEAEAEAGQLDVPLRAVPRWLGQWRAAATLGRGGGDSVGMKVTLTEPEEDCKGHMACYVNICSGVKRRACGMHSSCLWIDASCVVFQPRTSKSPVGEDNCRVLTGYLSHWPTYKPHPHLGKPKNDHHILGRVAWRQ